MHAHRGPTFISRTDGERPPGRAGLCETAFASSVSAPALGVRRRVPGRPFRGAIRSWEQGKPKTVLRAVRYNGLWWWCSWRAGMVWPTRRGGWRSPH